MCPFKVTMAAFPQWLSFVLFVVLLSDQTIGRLRGPTKVQRQPSEAPFRRDCRSASEEPILQEGRRLEIRIGGRSAAGRTERRGRPRRIAIMNLWRRRELERALLLLPSAAHANEREGRGKANIQKKGIENRNGPSVSALGLIKTSSSERAATEGG